MVDLLDLLEVKGQILKNRIVMPPMQTELATIKGMSQKVLLYTMLDDVKL